MRTRVRNPPRPLANPSPDLALAEIVVLLGGTDERPEKISDRSRSCTRRVRSVPAGAVPFRPAGRGVAGPDRRLRPKRPEPADAPRAGVRTSYFPAASARPETPVRSWARVRKHATRGTKPNSSIKRAPGRRLGGFGGGSRRLPYQEEGRQTLTRERDDRSRPLCPLAGD